MFAEFFKSKWLVIALFLPISTIVVSNGAIAAGNQGFSLQLQGPQVHTPSSPAKYGPVAKSDTLWSIATKTRPSTELNIYQTMEAILRLNPQAFLDGDINKVIDGSYLKLPTASMIRATDATHLQQKNSPLNNTEKVSKSVAKKPAKKAQTKPNKLAATPAAPSQLQDLQGKLTASNEDLLLSSETNRRLKIQLESIRVELVGLKEQMTEDNQLKIDLKKLIEDQKAQIALLQQEIESTQKQAEIDKDTSMTLWLIIGVASVFVILVSVWFGLWLKNRNDQKNVEEDSNLFESDNAVDELSEYLATDTYAVEAELAEATSETEKPAEVTLEDFSIMEEEETLDFNLSMGNDEPHLNIESEVTFSAPEMPEFVENNVETDSQSAFSDIDLTLDDESTSFDDDEITPDLSWRDELKTDNDELDDNEESLIPSNLSSELDSDSNEYQEDLAEIDDMLAQFRNDPVTNDIATLTQVEQETETLVGERTPAELAMEDIDDVMGELDIDSLITQSAPAPTADVIPEAKGQTVDEMLAELDGQIEPEPEPVVEPVVEQKAEAPIDVDDFDIDALMAENNATTTVPETKPDVIPEEGGEPRVESIDDILANNAGDLADALLAEDQPQTAVDDFDFPEPELESKPEPAEDITDTSANSSKPENKPLDNAMDDIESMLSEFGENAFSSAPSDQAAIDPVAAQAEEFIDIDKLLNDAGSTAVDLTDEPYDQVTLDVGLDEFTNSVIDSNDIDIDDDSNKIGAQLDLARAYLEIDDKDGAWSILEPLSKQGGDSQQVEIQQLLARL